MNAITTEEKRLSFLEVTKYLLTQEERELCGRKIFAKFFTAFFFFNITRTRDEVLMYLKAKGCKERQAKILLDEIMKVGFCTTADNTEWFKLKVIADGNNERLRLDFFSYGDF